MSVALYGMVYQMNDTRMGLIIALTAAQHGAAIANRVKVTSCASC